MRSSALPYRRSGDTVDSRMAMNYALEVGSPPQSELPIPSGSKGEWSCQSEAGTLRSCILIHLSVVSSN